MDEVKWYENNSLESIKNIIKDNINTASRSFLAIGYYLKNVRDRKLYQQDGYQDIWEFAHAEFGISQSWASRYMSINDRFSKDGNSPMIQEEFQGFDKSKLSEMLTLTDEQLKQVAITTTVAQIKDIKKSYATSHKTESEEKPVISTQVEAGLPKPSYLECPSYNFNGMPGRGCSGCVSDQVEHGCAYDRTRYLEEIKRQEDWLVHCEVLKAMCDSICMQSSYILETHNYSMETIRGLSRGLIEFSFGFGDDGTGHSKYDAQYRAERYYVEEFHGTGKWIFEAGEVDQHIWNFNGRDWKAIQHDRDDNVKTADDTPELVDDDTEIPEKGCNNCRYNDMTPEEFKVVDPDGGLPCNVCDDKLDEWAPKIDSVRDTVDKSDFSCDTCGHDINSCCDYDDENDWCELGSAWIPKEDTEQVETVEADIIQTVTANEEPVDYEKYSFQDVKDEFDSLTEYVATYRKTNESMPGRRKAKMRLDAITLLDKEMQKAPKAEESEPIQPALPILKNNDQRKDFIDSYTSWPIWIDQELTGERYYRYDLTDKVAIVVKVRRKHAYAGYKETKDYEYGAEQYYLLGIKSEWSQKGTKIVVDETRTFYECNTNKSALVDYLKDFQKKG